MKKIITTILFLIIQIISYSFEDNYIFNAERIKRVFSEWELVDEEKKKITICSLLIGKKI